MLKLNPDTDHDYFCDDDFPEEAEYDDDAPTDAFTWSCCQGNADAAPCTADVHEEDGSKRAKTRYQKTNYNGMNMTSTTHNISESIALPTFELEPGLKPVGCT